MYAIANENGVFEQNQCEVIRCIEKDWYVELLLAQASENEWYSSYVVHIGSGNYAGSFPSKRNSKKSHQATREGALAEAAAGAMEYLKKSEFYHQHEAAIKAAREWLNKQRFQMRLF